VSATQWSFSDSNVPAGTRSYTARVEDGVGNVGSISNSFSLTFSQPQNVTGTAGNDVLLGTSGADRISGVPDSGTHIGKGTKDVLTGGGGSDLFILGDSRGVFYNDGKNGSSGTGDYVRITDFGADDKLQLKGSLSEYFQAERSIDGFSGNAIYYDSNGNGALDSRDELIALVQSNERIDLAGMLFVF
jgi:Ca2+-binding RTX toxin-like protein